MRERIFLSPPWMSGTELPLIEEAFRSNYIAPCGPMVDRFEREFAQAVGLPHTCALTSGTAALELLFHELKIGPGDTVFCSALTFVASVAPAVHRGAVPVFIDCDAATWTMSPEWLEEALADAAQAGYLPKVVVAADLYGQCCDYERIEAACEKYGVPLIIDAAEALGAVYGSSKVLRCDRSKVGGQSAIGNRQSAIGNRQSAVGSQQAAIGKDAWPPASTFSPQPSAFPRMAGQAGWAAVYSFNGNKIITTSGGGMLASRDPGVVERARKRSQQAREPVAWYEHEELGFNHRMSNIVAAIGVGQLACLETVIQKKRQIFEWYREKLGGQVDFMPEAAYGQCTRWLTVVDLGSALVHYCDSALVKGGESSKVRELETGDSKLDTRVTQTNALMNSRTNELYHPSSLVERVRLALEAENIESRPVWKPMHLQPVFRGAKVYGGKVSERLFENGLCLPSGTGLTEADVHRVCETITRTGLLP